jgi:hypothetical protein
VAAEEAAGVVEAAEVVAAEVAEAAAVEDRPR